MTNKNWVISGVFLVAAIAVGVALTPALRTDRSHWTFYSEDDGASFYEAPFTKPPYVAPDGKPADLAAVYSTDGGKTKFVAYLMRASPNPNKDLDKSRIPPTGVGTMDVKKPGPGHEWIPFPGPVPEINGSVLSPEQQAYKDVVNVVSPGGAGHPLPCKPGD